MAISHSAHRSGPAITFLLFHFFFRVVGVGSHRKNPLCWNWRARSNSSWSQQCAHTLRISTKLEIHTWTTQENAYHLHPLFKAYIVDDRTWVWASAWAHEPRASRVHFQLFDSMAFEKLLHAQKTVFACEANSETVHTFRHSKGTTVPDHNAHALHLQLGLDFNVRFDNDDRLFWMASPLIAITKIGFDFIFRPAPCISRIGQLPAKCPPKLVGNGAQNLLIGIGRDSGQFSCIIFSSHK